MAIVAEVDLDELTDSVRYPEDLDNNQSDGN